MTRLLIGFVLGVMVSASAQVSGPLVVSDPLTHKKLDWIFGCVWGKSCNGLDYPLTPSGDGPPTK